VSQVSGVPDSFINLEVRGQNSIANGKDPLIIIDGIPFPSQPLNGALGGGAGVTASPLNALSPSDIASIEVLKDADATSIYGSRGANGVILITTKRAMQGGIRTTLRLLHGAGNITRRMDLMKTPDYLIMRREAYTNDGLIPGASDAPDLLSWDTTRYTDWQKVLIGRTMYNSDASISVNGGNSQTQFLLGAAWHRQTAVFPGDFGEDRKTTTLSVSHMPENRRLKITASTFYSRYHNKLPQSDFFSDITLSPNAPALYQADGELNWEGSSWVNPLTKQFATFESTTDNFNSNIDVSYHVLSSLWLRFTGGFSSLSSRDLIQTPKLSFNPAWGNASSAGFGSKTLYTIIGEPQAEYRQSLGHGNLSLLGGITLQQSRQRGLYQTGTGYASDDLLESVRAASQLTTVNESDIKYRYSGIFARISYEHAKKYLLTLTARRDGSSRYGDQERFANFGSAGMAWIFSSEPLLHKLRFLSFGKLKGSAGITGNDQIGDYRYLKLYNSGTYAYLGVVPYYPAQHYNPRFSWEKLRKLEAGLDLGFFDDRFLLMVNYYHNTTSNQLVNYPLPLATGFSGILRNIPAVIRNTGWEFEFNGKLLARTKLTWDMAFNITLPRNKLVSFDNLENSSYAYQYVIGQPLSIERKLSHTGLDRQTGIYSFRDYNNDGVIDYSNDLQQIIFTGQQYYGGWQNTITLGRFSGNVLFQFVRQKNGSNYLYLFSQPGRPYNQPGFLSDRWQKPGDNAGHQRYAYANSSAGASYFNYSQSDAAFSDASYIRLRNLSVSYSLFKKGKIPQGSFFVEGLNLVTITNYKGLDPENLSQSVPPVRMIVAGFQITL
ncbi:MAG TPA: SusC/RagA family TonB-linked outer membrane protein, partial [Chitinophagaceae bacterium]|nr:SusC/RagA family TonB-linked outer membrane protein [Chitinophagaceae bacterium]